MFLLPREDKELNESEHAVELGPGDGEQRVVGEDAGIVIISINHKSQRAPSPPLHLEKAVGVAGARTNFRAQDAPTHPTSVLKTIR